MQLTPIYSGRMAYNVTADDGQQYIYVPEEFVNKGFVQGNTQFFEPAFLQKDAFKNAKRTELPEGINGFTPAASELYKNPNKGFVWKPEDFQKLNADDFSFSLYEITDKHPAIEGMASVKNQWNDGLVYRVPTEAGWQARYIHGVNDQGSAQFRSTKVEPGRSILGDIFGGVGDSLAGVFNDTLGAVNDLGPWANAAIALYSPQTAAAIASANAGQAAGEGDWGKAAINAGKAAILANVGGGSTTQAPVVDAGGPVEVLPGAAPGVEKIAADYYGLPAGSQYVPPEVTELGKVAGSTEGIASGTSAADLAAAGSSGGGIAATPGPGLELASTTGAPTLTAGGTSLAEMGGAQGLTIPGAAGGTLGAAGLNAATGATAAGIGTGLGLSQVGTGALSNYGAAGAAAAGGSALADILPYTTGASVLGSVLQADAAKSAADQQSAAAQAAIAQQQKNFETINAQQAPYRAAGYNALNNIAGMTSGQTPQYDANGNIIKDANGNPVMTTGSGYFQHQFDAADLAKGLAPNYDFMLQQGQMANQRAANMGGGALGGNALQGLNKYTQDYAGNAYQNAFNNYQTQRGNIYNTLAGIAGIGQTGQTATNTAATNATNAASQLGIGSAAAQAAGTVGSANAYGNALNNVTNQYTLAALLNQGGRIG